MTFANIITKAKNIVGKVFVQHPNVLVSISDLLIERFISSFCFADGFIIRVVYEGESGKRRSVCRRYVVVEALG